MKIPSARAPRPFHASVIRCSALLLLAGWALPETTAAESASPESALVLRAFSDTSEVPDEKHAREALESLRYRLASDREANGTALPAAASPGGGLPPAMADQMRALRDKSIAEIQQQIASSNPAKEAEKIKQLENVLAKTRESYAAMLGEAAPASSTPAAPTPLGAVAAASPAETGRVLRIPAYGTAQPSFAATLLNLQKLLQANAPADALAAFRDSEDYASADRCAGSAAAALVAHRELAALAGLLRAHELQPKNAMHLVNLAGLTARFGLPRHALALLDAAEKLKSPAALPAVVNARAIILTTRGHALVQLRRFAEAETALRAAIKLEPGLSEAKVNLAHALFQQDDATKKSEAVQLMRFARQRVAVAPPIPPSAPAPGAPAELPAPPARPSAPSETPDAATPHVAVRAARPWARDVFDLSHGKAGSLPTIKIPRTVADAHALWPKVRKLQLETIAEMGAIGVRMNALSDEMRKRERDGLMSKLSARRARDVFWYLSNGDREPELRGLAQEHWDAMQDRGNGTFGGQFENPWASKELQDEMDVIRARDQPYSETCRQLYEATETYHASWLGPMHDIETDVNRHARKSYHYMTAIAAHLSDRVNREYARLLIRQRMLSYFSDVLFPLEVVCRYDYQNVQAWGAIKGPGKAEEVTPGSYPDADGCPDEFKGDYSAGASLKLFSVSINCEKVGFELSTGTWIKAFLAVDQMVDGSGAFFVGVAGDSGAMGSSGVSAVLKGGIYLCIDADGNVSDFGIKSSDTSNIGVSVAGFGVSYSREISHSFSFVAALKE